MSKLSLASPLMVQNKGQCSFWRWFWLSREGEAFPSQPEPSPEIAGVNLAELGKPISPAQPNSFLSLWGIGLAEQVTSTPLFDKEPP